MNDFIKQILCFTRFFSVWCLPWCARRTLRFLFAFVLLLGVALPASAEQFQYFYDDTSQLTKVVDSAGTVVEYIYDAVGNPLEVRRTAPAMAVLAMQPSSGNIGDIVTIYGRGFDPLPANNNVKFNGTPTTITRATVDTLTVTIPTAATSGIVSVTAASITASSSTAFTVLQAPVITGITRNVAVSGMQIPNFIVSGKNLTAATITFEPAFNPPQITVNSKTMAANGDAILNISIAPEAVGGFTVIASKGADVSSRFPSSANLLNVINPTSRAMPHLSASLDTSYVLPGAPITVQASVADGTGTPWSNEHVRFAIQNAANNNGNLNTNQTIVDAYTDAAGMVSVIVNDLYSEKIGVQVSMPYFAINKMVYPNFGKHTLITPPLGFYNNYDISVANANCNTVWDIYGSPYFVDSAYINITNGCRLQIDTGVVVKLNRASITAAYGGTLDIYGQAGAEVRFTSVNDNTVGGTLPTSTGNPAAGNWYDITYAAGSLGMVNNIELRYGGGLNIASSPQINNLTIRDSGGGISISAGAPTISNLTMMNVPTHAINVTSGTPVINQGSITGLAIATTSYPWDKAITVSGATTVLTMSNMLVSGGWYNLSISDGATGTFFNNIFDSAVKAAIEIATTGLVKIDSSNTITNTTVPYYYANSYNSWGRATTGFSTASLGTDLYATLGSGVGNGVYLNGMLAANTTLSPNPLRTINASTWIVDGALTIPNGVRLQIDANTIIKFTKSAGIWTENGGTLDIYGQLGAEVIFTSINDDAYGGVFPGSTGVPGLSDWGEWEGIKYKFNSSGSISNAHIRYGGGQNSIVEISSSILVNNLTMVDGTGRVSRKGLEILGGNPKINNLTIRNSGGINVNGGTAVFRNIAIINDTINLFAPFAIIVTGGQADIYSGVIHVLSTNQDAIEWSGGSLNMDNVLVSGGNHNLRMGGNITGVFTNNTFDGAAAEAISLSNNGRVLIDASNTISNAGATYRLDSYSPLMRDLYASLGVGIVDRYSVHIIGYFSSPNTILGADPLRTGNSVWKAILFQHAQLVYSISIGDRINPARLQIDPYTVLKFAAGAGITVNSGATLDVYGQLGAEVIFTSVNDDSIGATLLGSSGTPTVDWRGIIYEVGSQGSMSNVEDRYSGGINISSSPILSNVSTSSISVSGGGQPSISGGVSNVVYVSGVGSHLSMDGVRVIGGISIGSAGSWQIKNPTATLTNNIIEGSTGSGVLINTTGSVTMSGNAVLNNSSSGIAITGLGANSIIENNLIRGNGNDGIILIPAYNRWGQITATSNDPLLRNNLIIENNSGITIATGASATLESNTIANNAATAGTGAAVRIDGTVTMRNNIIALNLDSYGIPYDLYAAPTATISTYNNLTTDGMLLGAGDLYANPLFDSNWFVQAISPAINAGSQSAITAPFITVNPYAEIATVDAGVLDLGYHHATPAITVDANFSTLTPANTINAGKAVITLMVTPKDAVGSIIGSGLRITASLGVSISGATIGAIRDLGDGSYQVEINGNQATLGITDQVSISVEGAGGPVVLATFGSITW